VPSHRCVLRGSHPGRSIMSTSQNRLLASLPADEAELVAAQLERTPLDRYRVIHDPERPIEAVYFPTDGVISILSVMADGTAIETATVGREGMAGLAVFHGVDVTAEQAFVQVPGSAYRLESKAFRELLPRCPALTAALHRYAQALFTLAAQSSGCNRMHSMGQRCARWLLMVHDRVERDEFELTQSILSQMLGVRRATVTEAALELQRIGAIDYSRGRITVVSRETLEGASCECYGIVRSTFDRLLGQGRTRSPLADVRVSEDGCTTAKDGSGEETRRDAGAVSA
jgi:CRP-like cAMP-binding protein